MRRKLPGVEDMSAIVPHEGAGPTATGGSGRTGCTTLYLYTKVWIKDPD
ncbi:hypothetical protein acdb102_11880 [Acidothermaceae bacterium B102]|nr:hypothetical protein acdb102_11880 [Acidothermaceae bacterium B102]